MQWQSPEFCLLSGRLTPWWIPLCLKLTACDYFLDHFLAVIRLLLNALRSAPLFSSSLWLLCEGAKKTEIQPVRALLGVAEAELCGRLDYFFVHRLYVT